MSLREQPWMRVAIASTITVGALAVPLQVVPAWGKRHHGRRQRHARHHGHALASACPGANTVPMPGHLIEARHATLCLINEQRAAAGLPPLRGRPRLNHAARAHSRDMVARDYFDHTAPGLVTFDARIRRTGYLARVSSFEIGENIGVGTGADATPAAMVAGWMNSPEHRANILDHSFRDSGIGIAAGVPHRFGGGAAGATYTQDFGRRGY